MKKVAFYTLGCKLNFSETSSIARIFEEHGYGKVEMFENPEIVVINTCSVTENADKKCRKIVNDVLKNSENPYIVIVGCYAQLKPTEIANIPGVDAVLGASEKFRIVELLNGFEKKDKTQVLVKEIQEAKRFNSAWSINDRTRTFLKIQDGCDYSCSFCTIPLARGNSRSDTIENVVMAANDIAAQGVKEIVLTGVNTGDFGLLDGKREFRFLDLIQKLDQVDNINRFRISSIEPNLLSNDIIKFVAQSDKFVPHFHIPLQSGSNKILGLMRRRYKRELYQSRVEYIKQLMPDCCIGVDVIVGFPGESDDDFIETYQFLNELDISYLHVFSYSERTNTPAAEMAESVPVKVRNDRSKMLRSLSEKKRRFFYEQHLGKSYDVLFEEDIDNNLIHGFTPNYIRVAVPFRDGLVNTVQHLQLDQINLFGQVKGTFVEKKPEVSSLSA
ncbi:MAG: tRNA (N(6)-L-threonylcarbamoyladenosine(37)-C(2))-methylthiotransferase MtaB [Cyclobacteriaceae bacterium]|nr:tRNA (N(6)-L-threonylcarbamoyladenosine(37)-C(2))-methylthiotransferase MtaB [Cyclobacteriaceae bacterium]